MQFIFFISTLYSSLQKDIFRVFQAFDMSATDTQLLKNNNNKKKI